MLRVWSRSPALSKECPSGREQDHSAGDVPTWLCAEWFGSVGPALTICAFGKSWALPSQGSPQPWQCVVHG